MKRFGITVRQVLFILLGSFITAFGLCNIHAWSGVTEGGTLGLTLLLQHWTGLSPAVSSAVINAACFLMGWRVLGHKFLLCTAIACGSYSLFYALLQPFAPLIPVLTASQPAAALIGACFIGVGSGLGVRMGGATSGDDALAMALSQRLKVGVQWIYMVSDLTVLLLSLTYIPVEKIVWSLVTVLLSGQIIGWMQHPGSAKTR